MARLEILDPGFVRTRRGVRAVGATVLAWATMLVVIYVFHVADPVRITLFAAGAAFEGALLAPDPQPRDRVRTLGWAVVTSGAAVVATVGLTLITVWLAAGLLVLLMFSAYAVKPRHPRIASLALLAAITVYVTGGGHITVGRIAWFVLALAVGFGWLAVWESWILPENPVGALHTAVQVFSRRAADAVVGVVHVLTTTRESAPTDRAVRELNNRLARVRSSRDALERQFSGAVAGGMAQRDVDQLRVALYAAQKGLEDIAAQLDRPDWVRSLPDALGWSITSTLHGLAEALRGDSDDGPALVAVGRAGVLRGHIHGALTQTKESGTAPFPPGALLAASTVLSAGEVVAQSITQAKRLTPAASKEAATVMPETSVPADDTHSERLSPTMALAIQAVVAATAAGLIAKAVGNDQSLVVAWTSFVVIAGSAGLSARRAWIRLPATMLGAVGGVVIAACVPDRLFWTVAVVAVGVFFTIVSAPVSYPAMVFWMSIAFVPLFATEGRYLDLIWDKSVGALIGGCVAAVVTLTVVPIRSSREVRPAVITYLNALDIALVSHLPGHELDTATAEAELDAAYASLTAKVTSAATETNVFAQPESVKNDEVVHVDAVHEAYLRLTPLLSDASRQLHGWSVDQVENGIQRLRDAVAAATAAANGGEASASPAQKSDEPAAVHAETLELADSLRRIQQLHAGLGRLTLTLDSLPDAQKSLRH